MTLDVDSPEHDALMEAFEGMADLESPDVQAYAFPSTNREFLYFRAGYELGRKGEVESCQG